MIAREEIPRVRDVVLPVSSKGRRKRRKKKGEEQARVKRPEEEAEEVEEVVVRSVLADRPKFFKRFKHTHAYTHTHTYV